MDRGRGCRNRRWVVAVVQTGSTAVEWVRISRYVINITVTVAINRVTSCVINVISPTINIIDIHAPTETVFKNAARLGFLLRCEVVV